MHYVNCTSFMALWVLQCIDDNDCTNYPRAIETLQHHFYGDDICFEADFIVKVSQLQRDLVTVLWRADMKLKKWSSNSEIVWETVTPEDRAFGPLSLDVEETKSVKVLQLSTEKHIYFSILYKSTYKTRFYDKTTAS